MALEDYTTYDEVDPDGDLGVAINTITITTMLNGVEAHIQDDKGVNHFGDFEHLESTEITAATAGGLFGYWAVSNGYNTFQEMVDNTDGIGGYCYRSVGGGTPYRIYLRDYELANVDFWDCSDNVEYWLTIKRVKATTTATIKIYTDAARTVLVKTLTVTCNTTDYRYILAVYSRESGPIVDISGNVNDLDLQEVSADVSAGIKLWDGVADIELVKDDTSPVKIRTPGATIGVKVVATGHADASAIRVRVGGTTKSFKKKT